MSFLSTALKANISQALIVLCLFVSSVAPAHWSMHEFSVVQDSSQRHSLSQHHSHSHHHDSAQVHHERGVDEHLHLSRLYAALELLIEQHGLSDLALCDWCLLAYSQSSAILPSASSFISIDGQSSRPFLSNDALVLADSVSFEARAPPVFSSISNVLI